MLSVNTFRLLAVLGAFLVQGVNATPFQFDEKTYRHDVETLASDEFEGRGPLSKGETLTVEYLEKAYKAAKKAFPTSDYRKTPTILFAAISN